MGFSRHRFSNSNPCNPGVPDAVLVALPQVVISLFQNPMSPLAAPGPEAYRVFRAAPPHQEVVDPG